MVQKIRAIIGTVEDGAVITAEDVSPKSITQGFELFFLKMSSHTGLRPLCRQDWAHLCINLA